MKGLSMKTVYLSLGSNVGDREKHLARALERLDSSGVRVLRASALYETEPRDVPDQPWFLNQVVEAETGLFPMQLLQQTQKLERALGRVRTRPKGPRTIDIDILLYGDTILSTPGLEIPHQRMAERRFVLEPLAELAPELHHPRTGATVSEMLAQVKNQKVERV
jgi:2-amino-4-hydroxy-6-hydroxymethyldihydropteridine diphosphokinase